MPRFPSDESEEWETPEDFPSSDEDGTAVATTDPENEWSWAEED